MSTKDTRWLDYGKVNKFLYDIYRKTTASTQGYLRKVLDGDDWLITDGYMAFRVPDTRLLLRPSLFTDASIDLDKTIRSLFTVKQNAQKLTWTPRCIMTVRDKDYQRFYVSADASFAVLLGEKLVRNVNNLGYLSLYGTGTTEAVRLIDQRFEQVHAIIMPCRFNENDAAAIIPPVIKT